MTDPKPTPKRKPPFSGVHRFEDTAVRAGVSVLICIKCPKVWYPDQKRPGDVCRETRKDRPSTGGGKPSIENPVPDLMAPGGITRPRKST